MRLTDKAGAEGFLKITRVDSEGHRDVIFQSKNLITTAAKFEHLRFLWDSTVQVDPIVQFKVGDGGTLDGEGLFPRTEDPTQTDLGNPVLVSPNVNVDAQGDAVKFTFDVLTGEANGSKISEVGLFKQSGAIFNVKNFIAIPKTSAFSLHFEWTVKYA